MKYRKIHLLALALSTLLGAGPAAAQSSDPFELPAATIGEVYLVELADFVPGAEVVWSAVGDFAVTDTGDVLLGVGLRLDPVVGRIFGTPTTELGLDLTLTATDPAGTILFTGDFVLIAVAPAEPDPNAPDIVFDPPVAFIDEPYRFVFADFWPELAGATWEVLLADNVPPGLAVSSDGVLSGTPSALTDLAIPVRITTLDDTERRGLIVIPTIPRPDPAEAGLLSLAYDPTQGLPFSADLGADLGIDGQEFAVDPDTGPPLADSGLSLTTDGILSGTPNQVGAVEWGLTFVDNLTGELRGLVVTLYVSAPVTQLATTVGGGGSYEVVGMGVMSPLAGSAWVHSEVHGWLYFLRFSAGNLLYADPDLGWVASDLATWPHLYSFDREEWLWYAPGTTSPRWFYAWGAGAWLAVGD